MLEEMAKAFMFALTIRFQTQVKSETPTKMGTTKSTVAAAPSIMDERDAPLAAQLAHLQTGDVVLFSGSRILSLLVMCGTRSRFTHVGVVVRRGDAVLLSQSTPNAAKLADANTGRAENGVTETLLIEELKSGVWGGACYRRLAEPLSADQAKALEAYSRGKSGSVPYEKSKAELVFSGLDCLCCGRDLCVDCCNCGRPRDKSLFCSEWVPQLYREAGLMVPAKASFAQGENGGAKPGCDGAPAMLPPDHELAPVDFAGGGAAAIDELFGDEAQIDLPKRFNKSYLCDFSS